MVQNYLKQNGHRNLIRKWFWSYLELYNERSERLKRHFSVFCYFLSDEVEIIYWESEAKRSEKFKSKFGQRKLLRKRFWSYLELKNECWECLKRAFFSFLEILRDEFDTAFWGKRDNSTKTSSIKSALLWAF